MNAMTKTTTETPETIETPETTTPKTKVQKSTGVTLVAADGNALLRVVAMRKKDGSAHTYVVHTTKAANGKLNHARGASEKHPDMDAARARITVVIREALKLGWVQRPSRGGFKARPDAFDAKHLPTPTATKAATKK